MIPRLLLAALVVPPALAGAPALVTLTEGDVSMGTIAAPQAPFVLEDGRSLNLADGASAVVLHQGVATRFRGPVTIDKAALEGRPAAGDAQRGALDALLDRQVRYDRAGASRAGGLQLVRPVPGSTVLDVRTIRWTCDGCGAQDIQVYDFLRDKTVWTGNAEDGTDYGGADLAPGPYVVTVGGQDFSFTVADAALEAKVKKARAAADEAVERLKKEGTDDMASLTSIPASVYLQAGLASDALWFVDAAIAAHPADEALTALRTRLEQQAGVPGAGSP